MRAMPFKKAWKTAFTAITRRDNYIRSLERDGYWSREDNQ